MKVLHINTDASRGGAAVAARRHCEAMRQVGIDAKLLSLYGNADEMTIISDYQNVALLKKSRWGWIKHKLNRLIIKRVSWHWLSDDYNVTNLQEVKDADIIYIHWVNEFLGLHSIQSLLKLGKPVVWYMHDMWPITGGCHYSFECNGYEMDCKNCPQMKWLRSMSAHILKNKKLYWTGYKNLILAAPSQWLTDCIRKSSLFKDNQAFCIPNLIDTKRFYQADKKQARTELGLPLDKKLILFSAMGTHNPYKGSTYLVETLEKISQIDYEFVVVGRCDIDIFSDSVRNRIHLIGFVSEMQKMISVYNAVDVLLITSMADNFPNVVIEAMSCGVPVVGFATGGIKDQIKHQLNGWIVEPKDVEGLVEGVKWVLENTDYLELSNNARSYVEDRCSYNRILEIHRPLLEYVR